MGIVSVAVRGGGRVAVAAALALVLTGCSWASSTSMPKPSRSPSASASWPGDPAQELAGLRAAIAAPPQPFSAVLRTEVEDGATTARSTGTVNVSDVQTSSTVRTSDTGQTYLTVTRDTAYTRTGGGTWRTSPRPAEPVLADHRPAAEALLRSDPGSFRGPARIGGLHGGTGFHLVGRLPVAQVSGFLDATARERLAQHRVPDCATDLLLDAGGRLSRLTLTCEADGYRLRSETGLGEYGPATDTPPPTDL
ncbi:hypothetical protein AMK19_11550 [Kitasatospora sp. CB01950]|nr:hypothetical protein AMK19_11550 [Kitasatospora sp. CB01950]